MPCLEGVLEVMELDFFMGGLRWGRALLTEGHPRIAPARSGVPAETARIHIYTIV